MEVSRNAFFAAYRKDYAASCILLAERWLRDNPDDLGVILYYADMLFRMTRYEEAVHIYVDAIERFKDARWALYNQLGNLYNYRGDLAVAEAWYQKAIDEDPEEATSYIFLGGVQARQDKLKQAEATHRRAAQCPEGCIDEACHNVGLVLRGQGRLAEAAEWFRKAIEMTPKYANAIEALEDVELALALTADEEA